LRVDLAVLSQSNVSKYYGHEIIDANALGLDPSRMYRMYRPPEELAKAVPSACGLPILTAHEPVDAVEFRPDLLVGSTLSDARFQAPHLLCSIAIFSADAIRDIQSGAKGALSSGYRYTPIMRPGISPDGERYDGIMHNIVLNHVALVDVGRIGPSEIIADRSPNWRIEERVFADFRRRICVSDVRLHSLELHAGRARAAGSGPFGRRRGASFEDGGRRIDGQATANRSPARFRACGVGRMYP
jgi:hypothetical protein